MFFFKSLVDPPLHSTAIYADEEEFSKHCGSHLPSVPQEKEAERRCGWIASSSLLMVNGVSEMFFKRDAYKTKAFKDPSSHFMFFLKRTGTEKLNFSVIDVTYNNYN